MVDGARRTEPKARCSSKSIIRLDSFYVFILCHTCVSIVYCKKALPIWSTSRRGLSRGTPLRHDIGGEIGEIWPVRGHSGAEVRSIGPPGCPERGALVA